MYYSEADDTEEEAEAQSLMTTGASAECSRGHRSSLIVPTEEGGAICLVCFTNLVSDPLSPTLHVSYAVSQLSVALSRPTFRRSLLTFHPRLLVSSLASALSSFDHPPLARQLLLLVSSLCRRPSLRPDFIAALSHRLSSPAPWTPRLLYSLHCLGTLLKCEDEEEDRDVDDDEEEQEEERANPLVHIKDKYGLFSNLIQGLQFPSDEIRGEIMYVLYRITVLQYALEEDDGTDFLFSFCPKLLRLILDALAKIQSDDVRLNCVALLTVMAQRGFFWSSYASDNSNTNSFEADSLEQVTEDGSPLNILFSEAIKGPLLSTDSQVQMSTLNLLFHYISGDGTPSKDIQVLVDENIADYVFEILRLSECKDPIVNSCLQVLDLLSKAKQAFKQRLVVGFATLISVLQYIAEIPFHPVQTHTLRLIWKCVSDCPGFPSSSQIKEIATVLTRMLEKYSDGEMGMSPETFMLTCSIFVSLLKYPSSHGAFDLAILVKEALQHAVLSSLSVVSENNTCRLSYSLNLLKEVYVYTHEENSSSSSNTEVRNCILDLCELHLLPWFLNSFKEIEEEIVLRVLDSFQSILIWDSDMQALTFGEKLASSSWFSWSFGCLALFPTETMKQEVYMLLSSIVDVVLGNDSGQSIRDSALRLPSDPIDLLFLLGQKSSYISDLSSSQSAILTILYTSGLYDERLADDKLVLASLEDYILTNRTDFRCGPTDSSSIMRLLYLYGFYRGLAKASYQIPYNPEAERILIQLVNKNEWNLVTTRIHPISLRWLFQQEKFCEPLSDQIMKFCQSNISYDTDIGNGQNGCRINVKAIAELVASGDNYGARLLVCLLTKLVKEEVQESDVVSLFNLVTAIVNICPVASNELCLNNIGNMIHDLLIQWNCVLSSQICIPLLVLIFNLISSAHPEILSDAEEIWAAVISKLIEYTNSEPASKWTHGHLLVIGIFSLVLNRSTTNALVEASKVILFNSSLVSTIDVVIHEACQKGPALVDHNEGTTYGEQLLFVVLLNYFSLKSFCAVLPGSIDWQSFFDPPDRTQDLSVIGIPCHDLCRLMYFGSPLVKLVASHCLLELFTGISDQGNLEPDDLKCTVEYLMSVITVLEGFVFYSDNRVALNCSLCVSLIFGCEMLDTQDKGLTGKSNWHRLIVEELAASLSSPCLASKSFVSHHKPAIHIAIALLKSENIPEWMRSAFDQHSVSGIIRNLTANNVSSEIVVLFGELQDRGLLKTDQISSLIRVLQGCRKRLYTENTKGDCEDENAKTVVTMSGDLGEICEYLFSLMSSNSSQGMDFGEFRCGNRTLLEEVESFLRSSAIENGI